MERATINVKALQAVVRAIMDDDQTKLDRMRDSTYDEYGADMTPLVVVQHELGVALGEENLRRVDRLTGTGTWVRCSMLDLAVGDVFRSFEKDGQTVVSDQAGRSVWIVDAQPYLNGAGFPEVQHTQQDVDVRPQAVVRSKEDNAGS